MLPIGHALVSLVWCSVARPLLFCIDAERTHEIARVCFSLLLSVPGVKWATAAFFRVEDPRLRVCRLGIAFPNPVGLAAGMDKNAQWFSPLEALGFGFIEVGTVTAQAQAGNPKTRVFRLPADKALLNRMGSNNEGARAAARAHRSPAYPHSPRYQHR